MSDAAATPNRCGIDTVEIARIERLLRETAPSELLEFFTAQELADAWEGRGRAASLAARFAAKEACVKLFPREAALGKISPADFAVVRDNYGAPQIVPSLAAEGLMGRLRIERIALSLTHDRSAASAVALAEPAIVDVPPAGRLIARFLPIRRDVILANLRRVYGETLPEAEIVRLAQAHYAHLWRLFGEFVKFRWLSRKRKLAMVRVENAEAFVAARAQGKGVLLLTGHFGNWEVATVAGIGNFPEARGRFHFVRRPIKPRWLDALVHRRFAAAGFGVIGKRGSLAAILDRLGEGDAIVFPFDQHANPPDGIAVDFFGHPAWTFKSLAIMALATGAPVVPAWSYREPDGMHVLRFETPLQAQEHDDTNEAIRRNTRAYNAELERLILRRPEQWYWVHRRWKTVTKKTKTTRSAKTRD